MAATPVVPKAPPPPIDELPPDIKPAGDDVEWIGGYWHWLEEGDGYLWVSGCWRDAPPGLDWLPGQWVRITDGYHWVSGAWIPEGTTRIVLLPKPPDPIEEEPGPATASDRMFVPGTWVWKENRYAWRPGQWVEQPVEWVWSPAHYVWTPAGHLFVDGYWDQPLNERGLLYAPAVFPANAVHRVAYVPQFVIRPSFLEGALFVRAATKHYYFGDYFEKQYQTAGFVPWYQYRTSRVSIDPIFAHYRAHQRAPDWERSISTLYTARYEGRAARPPRTLVQQQEAVRAVTKQADSGAALSVEAQRNSPLVSVQQSQNNVQQTIKNVQNVTNFKVEQVVEERKNKYREVSEKRREAAKVYQETQAKQITQQGGGAAAPKAPLEVKVPALPRAARAQSPVAPSPVSKEPTGKAPQPPTPQPPAPKDTAPKAPPVAPPAPKNPADGPKPAPGKPPAAAPASPPERGKKAPPPPKFQPERENPKKVDQPGKGKGKPDEKPGKNDEKKNDEKKDDKKKDKQQDG